MTTIYLCLLKSLNYSTLVHQQTNKDKEHHKKAHVIMCFIDFFLMTENRILPQLLHTENASLNF